MAKSNRLIRLPDPIPGKTGVQGPQGIQGPQGDRGFTGPRGPVPKHEIVGERVRFEIEEGIWGQWIDFSSGNLGYTKASGSGSAPNVKYIQITDTTYTVNRRKLIAGTNIFGVATGAATTIYLPDGIQSNVIIHIKDELGGASSDNITVKLEGT